MSDDDKWTVGTNELCEILNVTRRRITDYVNEGMPKVARGKFDLPSVIRWKISRAENVAKAQIRQNSDKQQLTETNVEIRKIELAQLRGDLIDSKFVSPFINELGSLVSTQFDSIGQRCCNELIGLESADQIQEIINSECRTSRDTIATFIREQAVVKHTGNTSGDSRAAT
tara:strand:- start:287 stop:799 length:513 start_codon:yes stop_codon:yes gene_type:complete